MLAFTPVLPVVLAALARTLIGSFGQAAARVNRAPNRNSLLYTAAFSAFAAVFAAFDSGRVPALALLPAALVAGLLTLAAAWRNPILWLSGISLGSLYTLAGVAISLVQTL